MKESLENEFIAAFTRHVEAMDPPRRQRKVPISFLYGAFLSFFKTPWRGVAYDQQLGNTKFTTIILKDGPNSELSTRL